MEESLFSLWLKDIIFQYSSITSVLTAIEMLRLFHYILFSPDGKAPTRSFCQAISEFPIESLLENGRNTNVLIIIHARGTDGASAEQ